MSVGLSIWLSAILTAVVINVPEAARTTVVVGGQAVTLPDPPGLKLLRNKSSPYYRFGESMQAANNNKLLAAYLDSKQASVADAGQLPLPEVWAIAFSMGALEGKEVTPAQFRREFVPNVEDSLAKAMKDPGFQKKIDSASDKGMTQLGQDYKTEPGKLRIGQVTPFGIYARKDNYFTYGAGTRVQVQAAGGNAVEQPVVMVMGFVVVKDRLFVLAVYNNYSSSSDVESAKSRAIAWAEAVTKANP